MVARGRQRLQDITDSREEDSYSSYSLNRENNKKSQQEQDEDLEKDRQNNNATQTAQAGTPEENEQEYITQDKEQSLLQISQRVQLRGRPKATVHQYSFEVEGQERKAEAARTVKYANNAKTPVLKVDKATPSQEVDERRSRLDRQSSPFANQAAANNKSDARSCTSAAGNLQIHASHNPTTAEPSKDLALQQRSDGHDQAPRKPLDLLKRPASILNVVVDDDVVSSQKQKIEEEKVLEQDIQTDGGNSTQYSRQQQYGGQCLLDRVVNQTKSSGMKIVNEQDLLAIAATQMIESSGDPGE